MNPQFKALVGSLLALSFSGAALAKKSGTVTTPPPTTTTTAFTASISGAMPAIPQMTVTQDPLAQTPELISGTQSTASTYAMFFVDTRKVSYNLALSTLNTTLKPYSIAPCGVSRDINGTGIACGNKLVQFGGNEFFTTSHGATIGLDTLPLKMDPAGAVKQVLGANFLSPVNTTPGDSYGRLVHVHFSVPVSQFVMRVGYGQLAAPSVSNLKFIVGTNLQGPSVTKNLLTPEAAASGGAQWVGVQLAAGFQDLMIVPEGDDAQSWTADLISVLPKTLFTP